MSISYHLNRCCVFVLMMISMSTMTFLVQSKTSSEIFRIGLAMRTRIRMMISRCFQNSNVAKSNRLGILVFDPISHGCDQRWFSLSCAFRGPANFRLSLQSRFCNHDQETLKKRIPTAKPDPTHQFQKKTIYTCKRGVRRG